MKESRRRLLNSAVWLRYSATTSALCVEHTTHTLIHRQTNIAHVVAGDRPLAHGVRVCSHHRLHEIRFFFIFINRFTGWLPQLGWGKFDCALSQKKSSSRFLFQIFPWAAFDANKDIKAIFARVVQGTSKWRASCTNLLNLALFVFKWSFVNKIPIKMNKHTRMYK